MSRKKEEEEKAEGRGQKEDAGCKIQDAGCKMREEENATGATREHAPFVLEHNPLCHNI